MVFPEQNILVPPDKHHLCNRRAGPMGYACLGPISLGERRKVAEQREVLKSGWVSQAGADYPPPNTIKSTAKWLKFGYGRRMGGVGQHYLFPAMAFEHGGFPFLSTQRSRPSSTVRFVLGTDSAI